MNKLEWRHQTGKIKPSKENEFFSKMKKLQRQLNETKEREEANSSSVLKEVQAAEALRVLRMFRIARLFRLVRFAKGLNKLVVRAEILGCGVEGMPIVLHGLARNLAGRAELLKVGTGLVHHLTTRERGRRPGSRGQEEPRGARTWLRQH